MEIGCPSDWYTTVGDSYLSTISNTLSLNPGNFNCCHSPRSQLYPPSKFCNILQHTDNSVPCSHLSYALTRGIMYFLQRSHMQGRSWSTQFSVFHISGPQNMLVIQPCWCLEFIRGVKIIRCVWFNSRNIGLNLPPILASIAYLDTRANIQEIGAWRDHLIRCTWHCWNHNKQLA